MTNSNNTIRNLHDLQLKKAELKARIDKGIDSPIGNIVPLLSTIISKQKKRKHLQYGTENTPIKELMNEGINATLTLLISLAVTKLKLGTIPKLILTSTVSIATPYIVNKVQKKLQRK